VLPPAAGDQKLVSPITTHVLDSALGCPAKGLPLALYKQSPGAGDVWAQLAGGVTNDDGRVPNLLPASDYIAPGRCEARSWACLVRPAACCLGAAGDHAVVGCPTHAIAL
jgi:hypothetical protein